jgi:3-dehydroquinate dehydratase/shikimate dehydrogenase
MTEEYNYERITEATEILGVIADPVAHSFSPSVHNACIRNAKLDMLYLPFRVPPEHLEEFIKICPELGVRGLSVTIPHKQQILKSLNAIDDNVAGIRAANTVVFRDVNAYGYNTDCQAAMTCLIRKLELDPDQEKPFKDIRFCIMGAGGAARAIGFGVMRMGGEISITARDYRKSEELADDLGCQSIDWPTRQNHECDVLINCTPVGMHPNLDESPFEADWLSKKMLVFDSVYNPEQTLLIKFARDAECEIITGVDMFVLQAAQQFKLFTGKEPDVNLIRYEVKRATSAARY